MGSGGFNSAVNGGFSLFCWCVDTDYALNQPDGSMVVNNVVVPASAIAAFQGLDNSRYAKITVIFKPTVYKYIQVSGEQAADAAENSGQAVTDAVKADTKGKHDCAGNGGGCISPTLRIQPTKEGFTITYTLTMYLTKWTGYNSAESYQKKLWDDWAYDIKTHEEIHVRIFKLSEGFLKNKIPATVKTVNQLEANSNYKLANDKIDEINDAFDDLDDALRSKGHRIFIRK